MDLSLRTYLRLTSLIIGGAAVAGVLATSTTACDRRRETRARAAEEVADPHVKRDAILDSLYTTYSGSAGDVRAEAHRIGDDVKDSVDAAAGIIDRAAFDARCEAVGHGAESAWTADARTQAFFDRPEVRARCEDVARLHD